MGRAIAPQVGQLVQELSAGALGQPLRGQRRAQQVPAQVLELLAGVRGQGDVGVEREALPAGAAEFGPVHHCGGGAQPAHGLARAGAGSDHSWIEAAA